jgi:uncharacterized protein YndB with AHSA1/START domain
MSPTKITVTARVNAPVDKVWKYWSHPDHIRQWNAASDEWHSPSATNDLRKGGAFSFRMEARDGSKGFDFNGVYDEVKLHERVAYTLGDGRKVSVLFSPEGNTTVVSETFEAENMHSLEMQQAGWQAILDNFRKYVESPSPVS